MQFDMLADTPGEKSAGAFKTISEAAESLNVPAHVLRFWESKFPQIKPTKLRGRRYYRPEDIDVLVGIKQLLYKQGFTIKGAQKALSHKEPLPADEPAPLSDEQHDQLSVIRAELSSLRDTLKSFLS